MRRFAVIMPITALIAGAAGLFLRYTELNTVFDSVTGFAERGAKVSYYLMLLSVAAFVVSIIYALIVRFTTKASSEYERAFAPASMLYLVIHVILGLAMLFAAYLYWRDATANFALTPFDIVFIVFAALTGISLIFMACGAYKGKSGTGICIFSVIPAIFFCIWLILIYKRHSSDPVLLNFCYQCLAAAFAALSFYYGAGFVFGRPKPAKTIVAFFMSIFFCTVVLLDNISKSELIIYVVVIVTQLVNSAEFIRNLEKRSPVEMAEE